MRVITRVSNLFVKKLHRLVASIATPCLTLANHVRSTRTGDRADEPAFLTGDRTARSSAQHRAAGHCTYCPRAAFEMTACSPAIECVKPCAPSPDSCAFFAARQSANSGAAGYDCRRPRLASKARIVSPLRKDRAQGLSQNQQNYQ